MKLSILSSLAFAAAMLASPAVIAQDAAAPTMIGTQSITADDLPKVQAQCNTLAAVDNTSMSADANTSPDGAGDLKSSETPDGTAAATSKVDLALITIEDCKAAGLVK